jgi:hypothetical protein
LGSSVVSDTQFHVESSETSEDVSTPAVSYVNLDFSRSRQLFFHFIMEENTEKNTAINNPSKHG